MRNPGVCVYDDAVAAAALGLVEGVVGGGAAVNAGVAGLAGDGELGEPLADPLGDLEGLGGCGAGEQQGEFLAAEPAAQVEVAQQVPHGGGDRGEHGVSGEVAVSVVDGFEVVDVSDGDRQRSLRPGGPGDLHG